MIRFRLWLIVLVLTTGAAGASGFANWWFYRSLADELVEGLVYAVMGASADVWKVVGLSATAILIAERKLFWAWLGRLLWGGAVVASIIAAIGFSSAVQAGMEDPRANAIKDKTTIEAQIAADEADLTALLERGEPMPPEEARAALARLLDSPAVYDDGTLAPGTLRTQLTARTGAYCDGAFSGPLTVKYCGQIRELEGEIARADRYVDVSASLRTNRTRLLEIETPSSGEAEAAAFSTLAQVGGTALGWKTFTVIFFAFLIEALACTGESFMRLLAPKWRLKVPRVDLAIITLVREWREAAAGHVRRVEPAPVSKPKPRPAPSVTVPAPPSASPPSASFAPIEVDSPVETPAPPPEPVAPVASASFSPAPAAPLRPVPPAPPSRPTEPPRGVFIPTVRTRRR
jgi:hypothetical protein